ncbi:MAG: hypothetical protein C4334_01675 [Pyrinomonas sp.]|uniref:substrate-binding domain-containing protein n=1 Tax=Pyrinomonas sp. TaxID=2080306 RepID=UPI003333DC58
MRRWLRAALFVLIALCCFGGVSCQRDGTSGKKRIGVTLLTREHAFYRDLEAGMREAAEKNGFELLVSSGDFDLAKQQSQIENFIVQGVDAIIVCPADTRGIGPAIERANSANIPVFTADIAAQGGRVVAHVASDNVEGGRLAARYIAQALDGRGRVGIIGQPEVQSTIDRESGFKEEMRKHPGIQIVSVLNGAGVRDRALKAADDMLQSDPEIKAIFAINDDSALGALSAAEARGRADLIIVGYDATAEALRAIKRGSALRADVAQDPRAMGQQTIDAIARHLRGEPVPANITIPVRIVDARSSEVATLP